MNVWRARGIELLLLAGKRALTDEERAELAECAGRAA